MPADGLEAQDVVPPRCGCWVAHKPSICRAFSHARARQPSQLSLISLAFLSRVRKYGSAEGEPVLIEWREVRDGNGSGGPNEDTARTNASFNHAPTIAGQSFRVPLAARPLLSICAFRAKFGLRVIWLSEARVPGSGRPPGAFRAGSWPPPVLSPMANGDRRSFTVPPFGREKTAAKVALPT
jgi:hypothetical protein